MTVAEPILPDRASQSKATTNGLSSQEAGQRKKQYGPNANTDVCNAFFLPARLMSIWFGKGAISGNRSRADGC
jgi:hypothetical protein